MTSAVGRTLALAALSCCLLVTATGGVAAVSDPPSSAATASPSSEPAVSPLVAVDGDADRSPVRFAVQETETGDGDDDENETVRHRNPDTYDEAGDEAELERWLSNWLSNRLEQSATEISQGEYDRASEYVDEEFEQRLEQYVEVAGDGDGDGGDGDEPSAFQRAGQEQRNLTESLATYDETLTAYEEAREAGDDERARELARELESLATEIGDSSRTIRTHYDAIDGTSETDLSDEASAVESTNRSVQTEQQQIREREFRETELSVTATGSESPSISFTEPLVATGELRTADGSPIANERIRLNVGNRVLETETDETGAFEFEYRPISVPADAESVTVRYVPDRESAYLESETTVPVDVEQVEPTLSIAAVDPDPVAAGDRPTVDATLSVDGRSIDDVPLAVSLADANLGVGSLEAGTVTLPANATVPATVPSGERTLAVTVPFEDRALASVTAETTVTVAETESALSLTASRSGNRTLTVNGTLTAAGDGVGGEPVQVRADGTTLETMTTDDRGAFGGPVSVPEAVAADDVRLTAVYDGAATNLARAEAETTVAAGEGSSLPSWSRLAAGVAAVVVVIAGAAGFYRYRRRTGSVGGVRTDDGTAVEPTVGPTAESTPSARAAEPDRSRVLLDRANDHLADGEPDDAVRTCYAAVRRTLEARLEAAGTRSFTHWEFYRRYRDAAGDASTVDPFRAVTEGYEQAAFGTDPLSDDEAETLFEYAQDLCAAADQSTADPLPADD